MREAVLSVFDSLSGGIFPIASKIMMVFSLSKSFVELDLFGFTHSIDRAQRTCRVLAHQAKRVKKKWREMIFSIFWSSLMNSLVF